MIVKKNAFVTIEEFIEHLKKNENVIGIVEYGGRTYTDMSIGGDYDLTVIFDQTISKNVSGVHFHIQDIPIDCMLLSKDDFLSDTPGNEFLLTHLNCKILYDKDNLTSDLMNRIRTVWNRPIELSDFETNLYRFTFKHVLDKLKHRLYDNVLYTNYFIYSSVDWFLASYARIKGWEIGKPKMHLTLIQQQEPVLYDILNNLYSENNLDTKFELLSQCANYMLQCIGGFWAENEYLFHLTPGGSNDEQEQIRLIKILLNE